MNCYMKNCPACTLVHRFMHGGRWYTFNMTFSYKHCIFISKVDQVL